MNLVPQFPSLKQTGLEINILLIIYFVKLNFFLCKENFLVDLKVCRSMRKLFIYLLCKVEKQI